MLEGVEVLYHSCIRIEKNKIIYFDPFEISQNYNDADIVFITHDHYDHYSPKDIEKVVKTETIFVAPHDVAIKIENSGVNANKIVKVIPNEKYDIKGIKIETVLAYNVKKQFHPKKNNWVGYVIELDNVRYYIAGDTDITEENKNVKCDVAFVPVGGTFTMTANEAAELVNIINPKIAVPIHYGGIVGTKDDAQEFLDKLSFEISGQILLK